VRARAKQTKKGPQRAAQVLGGVPQGRARHLHGVGSRQMLAPMGGQVRTRDSLAERHFSQKPCSRIQTAQPGVVMIVTCVTEFRVA